MIEKRRMGLLESVEDFSDTNRELFQSASKLATIVLILLVAACSSSGSSKKVISDDCLLNSDCASGLTCTFGRCHTTCVTSQDCPAGATCVKSADNVTVCQLPAEAACINDSGCPLPLVCGIDQNCRGTCTTAAQCPSGQKCANQNVCADPAQVDGNNDLILKHDGGGVGTGGAGGRLDGGAAGDSGGGNASDGARAGEAGGLDVVDVVAGDSGSGDGVIDAPTSGSGGDAASGAGGGAGGSAGGGGSGGGGGAGGGSCVGQAPTRFGHVATGDSNPNYTSGIGVRTATDFVVFSGYVGPSPLAIDGGVATVHRIDVQHFDPTTGASKGKPTPFPVASGDGSGLYVNGAAVAPTGEIAIIYSAATTAGLIKWGVYLAFLDKDLALQQTTQLVALGLDKYADQAHVQWLNGKFVASAVVNNPSTATIKMAKFGADGSNSGSTSAIPSDDPSGFVSTYNNGQSEVAYSGGLYASTFFSIGLLPYLTILDTLGAEVGSPVKLPSALSFSGYSAGSFASVAGTANGFVAVYNGTSAANANSLLATFVSNSAPVDAGTVAVGSTVAFPGGFGYGGNWSARGSSDGIGAGFAVLYPDGSVNFIYFGGNGVLGASPQSVLQQASTAAAGDEVQMTNYGGNFAVSLYSSGEHLTRMVASSCQ
jgi:hypothetical protein